MSEINDGGNAFPFTTEIQRLGSGSEQHFGSFGMSLRAYLTGKALSGFCSNPAVFASNDMCGWSLVNCTGEQLAKECVSFADALIAELNRKPTT